MICFVASAILFFSGMGIPLERSGDVFIAAGLFAIASQIGYLGYKITKK